MSWSVSWTVSSRTRSSRRCPWRNTGALRPSSRPVRRRGSSFPSSPSMRNICPPRHSCEDLDGIPLLNIRHIPLDNLGNAFFETGHGYCGLPLPHRAHLSFDAGGGHRGQTVLSRSGDLSAKAGGEGEKAFYMYKFRSMRVNSDQDTGWSRDRDDRKTKFGAFIRKCSLDELPQFFNVLLGSMSLVGPRPEVPYYVDQFKDEIPSTWSSIRCGRASRAGPR